MDDLSIMRKVYEVAISLSTDPSTQNAASLYTAAGVHLVSDANHFPHKVKETEERWQRPLKYSYVEHAERNVIYLAAKLGIFTKGSIMYCPWFACAECSRAIIQAGITEVVGHQVQADNSYGDWKKSIEVALGMFDEAGVKYRWIQGHCGVKIRFNGELVER